MAKLLFVCKERGAQNSKQANQTHFYEGEEKKSDPLSFRVLCYLHRDAGYSHLFLFFFCPPAFQDNNLNLKPELHFFFFFALLKHYGNL